MHNSRKYLTTFASIAFVSLQFGCGGKEKSGDSGQPKVNVSGTVTYDRLASSGARKPARGVLVRAVVEREPVEGGKPTWEYAAHAYTNSQGKYSLNVAPNAKVFVELLSETPGFRVVADKITNNTAYITDRPVYSLRMGLDGKTANASKKTPSATASANSVVHFAVQENTTWFKAPFDATQVNSSKVVEAERGAGNRALGVLDTLATVKEAMELPKDTRPLDLHFLPGDSLDTAATKDSFVEYDTNLVSCYPAPKKQGDPLLDQTGINFDANGVPHYFGKLHWGRAWDERLLIPMATRHLLFAQLKNTLSIYSPVGYGLAPTRLTSDRKELENLRPEMALVEGLADAAAAIILKSPELSDPNTENKLRDISKTTDFPVKNIHSSAHIAATAWELACQLCGGPQKLDYAKVKTLFALKAPEDKDNKATDVPNYCHQLIRLKEGKSSSESEAINKKITDFSNKGAKPFITKLTKNALPDIRFTLEKGTALNGNGEFSNLTKDEVLTYWLNAEAEQHHRLTLSVDGPLEAAKDAKLELIMDNSEPRLYSPGESFSLTVTKGSHLLQCRLILPKFPLTGTVNLKFNLTPTNGLE